MIAISNPMMFVTTEHRTLCSYYWSNRAMQTDSGFGGYAAMNDF